MDMISVDVSGRDVSPGDEVVLIGRQDDEEITAREIAAEIGSIPWEVSVQAGKPGGEGVLVTSSKFELRTPNSNFEVGCPRLPRRKRRG